MSIRCVKVDDIKSNNVIKLSGVDIHVFIDAVYGDRIGYRVTNDVKWKWTNIHELIYFLNSEFGGMET